MGVTIALVNGKPQFPGFGPVGPGPVGPGPVGPGPLVRPAPITYGFPVCPEDVCTACEEEGVTDMKAILEIDCQDGIEEDCYAASKECQKSTKECYVGPGPCIRDAEIETQKGLSEVAEETTKCVREQEITITKCANDKRAKIAKAEECLACAPGCKKDE